jgi:hypothetical protein
METLIHSSLFIPGGCLTSATMQRYIRGTLRPIEKSKVEDHLRHCLICSEALEGYKKHRTNNFILSDLETLTGRVHSRFASKKINRPVIPSAILISLLVFFMLLFMLYYILKYMIMS